MNQSILSGGRRVGGISALTSKVLRHRLVPITLALLSVSLVLAVAPVALAGTFYYGTFGGNDMDYVDVKESSATDPGPLFGTPTVSANSLSFSPDNFYANSNLQSPPLDRTDGRLVFNGVAHAGKAIDTILFQEGGARSVGGFGTNQTYVDVSAVGFLQVHEIDGVPVNVQTFPINLTFDFGVGGNGTWRLGTEGADTNLWSGSQLLDIKQGLISRGLSFVRGATKISVNMDNILYAQSETMASAFIDKKLYFNVTTNIPEPTAAALALLGVVFGMVAVRRGR